MGLSLNIDIYATSFFKPVKVVQFVLEFLNLSDASRPLTDRNLVKVNKAFRGVRVETNHKQDQIRRYKITGITPIPMSQLIFPVDERGTRMPVVQYFMQRNLQYTTWPFLQSGSDAWPVYLPMEACKVVEGQRYSKKLNDKQVTNILRATCQIPQQREQSIPEMVLHNEYAEDRFAQEFGIKVCSDLVSVPARVLPPPMLRCHDYGKEKTCALSIGQWNMINKKMINGGAIDNCRELPAYDGRESLCTADSLPSESEEFSGTLIDPEMKDNERAEWEFKMITQKIINGGTIDNLENGAPFVSEVPTVIVTAPVSFPVVASMDKPETSKYGGLASAQPYMQEVLEDLFNSSKDSQRVTANGGKMNELLITFRRKTGRRPQRIVFRDGVSEDQFCEVLFHKTDRIRKAHASFENEHILPVNFVVDQKKHHTRLFPKVHVRHGSLNNVSSINGAVISQEEPLEAHHPPNLDSIIQFFVDINGRRVSVQRTPEADLGSAIAEAMLKTNCYIPDFYVGYEQHVLDLDQSILSQKIGQNSTVQVRPRVRGGVETIDMSFKGIRFEDRIQSFSHDDLFEERTIRPELMGTIRRIRRGHLQSYGMDPYVVLTHSYGLQRAFGYWVQPVGDGSTGYIQPVWMAVS